MTIKAATQLIQDSELDRRARECAQRLIETYSAKSLATTLGVLQEILFVEQAYIFNASTLIDIIRLSIEASLKRD